MRALAQRGSSRFVHPAAGAVQPAHALRALLMERRVHHGLDPLTARPLTHDELGECASGAWQRRGRKGGQASAERRASE